MDRKDKDNNTFEYVFVKDMHLMYNFRNNIRQTGWEKAVDDKLRQIIDYMTVNKITNLFTAGDIFDKTSDWSFKQFQANVERLRWFKKAGIKLYSNLGNHDMAQGRESVEGTIFKAAVDLDLLTYVGSGMEPIQFSIDGEANEVLLFGVDYHVSLGKVIDEVCRVSDYPRCQQSTKTCKLVLMHSNVTSEKSILSDLTYGQLADYDIDIFNLGHYHLVPSGGAIQKLKDSTFLNPWNLTRVSRDYHAKLDEHKPEFIHTKITFVKDQKPTVEAKEIFLKVGKFSETFNVDTINMLQELGKGKFAFFDDVGLDGMEKEEMSDDEVLLQSIAKAKEISEDSIKIAKELLS